MQQGLKDYEAMKALSKRIHLLGGITSLLDWDQETYMPKEGADNRGAQSEILAGIIHREKTGRKYTNALSKLADLKTGKVIAKGLDERQKAAVREWYKDWWKDHSLPPKFVEEMAKHASQSIEVWKSAREANSFQQFAPYLEKTVELNKRKADYLGYKEKPYDALLDLFEPEMTTKIITPLFTKLKEFLIKQVKEIKSRKVIDDSILLGTWEHSKQLALSHDILKDMGYNFNKGRLDLSAHPFSSSIGPNDDRITTRLINNSIISNISTSMHEGGHSLYSMGLPVEEFGTPLGDAISMGIHESQSRWWETRIGLSQGFWEGYLPLLKKHFPALDKLTVDSFYKAINKVEPTMIRVESDEVTYSLHVILRYELEEALIHGKIKVKDVPEAWNGKMEEFLGIRPKTNAEGCLQDIHWSMGAFGYFPSYTIGNMYAAQFFETFEKEHPNWEKRIAKRDLLFIKEWLNNHIHSHGRRYNSQDLLKKVTGKEFTVQPYLDYLGSKYKKIYK